ncbi:GCC2 and GCC3 [Necator americanus]|uniref:GCC2 and GCC3 n=1 Tax=Necator americanus TaxID=51031 RepID=W2T2Z9_NECAM|nr:GCC2 and GCC3 [Necator americanus]ETN75616.1 GCC2 and GCC3 [Necator americanus]
MFVDNVGVVSIKSNYRSGQTFTWGYYRVVYVASDAAGNLAFCSFSVVVSPVECEIPKADIQLQGNATFENVNGTDAIMKAQVDCIDKYYPRADPEFYVCDIMIRQRLLDSLLNDLEPYCGNCTGQFLTGYLLFSSTRDLLKNTISNSLEKEFPNSTLSINEDISCDAKYPHFSRNEEIGSCADCSAGHYWDEDHCVECPVDTYRGRNDPLEKCNKCPENTTTSGLIGQKNEDACHEICDTGEYYDEWLKKCLPCPLGTYQEKRGSVSCLPCAADTTTGFIGAKNATDCSFKCGAGQELDAEGRCVPCARGTYWVSTNHFAGCVECPLGLTTVSTASKDIGGCEVVNCPVGTHVNTNRPTPVAPSTPFSSLCVTCEIGTYQTTQLTPVQPAQPATTMQRHSSFRESMRARLREHHLPPPIITSRVELDLLEQQARRQSIIMGVIPTPSRNLGSQIAVGYSPESPGPSISAQITASKFTTQNEVDQHPPLYELPENASNSYSLHRAESSPYDESNVFEEDDDEDYFG